MKARKRSPIPEESIGYPHLQPEVIRDLETLFQDIACLTSEVKKLKKHITTLEAEFLKLEKRITKIEELWKEERREWKS